MIKNNVKNTVIQTGYVISTTYVNGVAVCEINSDMSPNLTFSGFLQYLQPGVLCNIPNNTKVALSFSPNKHVGGVTGAVNIIPEDNTTLTGGNELKSGEVALVNIDNFNYSIQAKVDSLVAIFKSDDGTITTKALITENIVLILIDIIKEFDVVKKAINTHLHSAGDGTLIAPSGTTGGPVIGWTDVATVNPTPSPGPPVPPFVPYTPSTPLVKNDNDYLSKAECYVNNDGKGTIPK